MGLTKSTQDFVQKMIDASLAEGATNVRSLGGSEKVDVAKIIAKHIMSQPRDAVVDIFLPAGNWYFQSTLYWEDRTVNFRGAGIGKTFIYVTSGIVGMWANRKRGIVGVNTLSDFWIGAGSKEGTNVDADGIRVWHQSTVRNVAVSNFGGSGIHIDGYVVGDPDKDAAHNASFSKVYDCAISANNGHGIWVDGSDGNACVTFANDIRNNGGFGVFASSFLGGTNIANMLHANAKGAYGSDSPGSQETIIGGYVEGDQPANQFVSGDIQVIGGFDPANSK
jgi:hypothetical protein